MHFQAKMSLDSSDIRKLPDFTHFDGVLARNALWWIQLRGAF
jgi:hypothetical protein